MTSDQTWGWGGVGVLANPVDKHCSEDNEVLASVLAGNQSCG